MLLKCVTYGQTSNIDHSLVSNKIIDHSDVIGAALLQLHLHFRLNSWLQWIRQGQQQDETRNI